jgi:hypothetical protein
MLKSFFKKIRANRILQTITIVTAVVLAMGVFSFTSTSKASAATDSVSVNLIYYGTNTDATDQSIIDANPEYLVDNSSVGPWGGNADISKFMDAGIKYFEYIDGGYEGTVSQAIPNDLQSNLDYITAIAAAGAYGVFIDEVSAYPSAEDLAYLKQLSDYAHSLGLKVVFNVGVDSWSDSLMEYCDYINSSEIWSDTPLTDSQTKWASQTWFLTQGVNDATTAAELTNAALSQGIDALYACTSYTELPSWLDSYIALVDSGSPDTTTTTTTTETTTTTTTIPETTTTSTVTTTTPVTTTTEATTTTTTITTPAASTTIVTTPVSNAAEGNTTDNFFTRLFQSMQNIWSYVMDWLGI